MKRILVNSPVCSLALGFMLSSALFAQSGDVHLAQGILAGEVTQRSAILQTRLTAVSELTDGDVAGVAGTGRFEIATNDSFRDARQTPWSMATSKGDFILKTGIGELQPGTEYFYRVIYGPDAARTRPSPAGRFKTL